jgi:hypothetical protein
MIPKIICLTPVKNEAWILDTFLKSASIWADHIILADQNSTDNGCEIISQYPKAKLIRNDSSIPNEPERQQLLLDAAREIPGLKLIIAIDADELLSPEAFNKNNWKSIFSCEPGTIFRFQWASFYPNTKKYKLGYLLPYGYMDDGCQHTNTNFFHGSRVPTPKGHSTYDVTEFKVIHLQYMNPERNEHRQRWYQCLELDNPSIANDPIDIYRRYHHNKIISDNRTIDIPPFWIEKYSQLGINLLNIYSEEEYWYDEEVLKLFERYGYHHYKKLNIWNEPFKDKDPRNIIDKLVHFWLTKSQPHYFRKARKIDDIIRRVLKY